jgi:branched-chain amino acid transport system permease protein
MDQFYQQFLSGLATGGIYALVALAVVMIYRAIDHFNFAQGEMAMFSTYIAFQLMQWGLPYWVAFFFTLVISFGIGVFIDRVVFKPIHDAPVLSHIVVFIGMLAIFNSVAGWIWDFTIRPFPSPFPQEPIFGRLISTHHVGIMFVTLIVLGLTYAFFRFTTAGLSMRAAASDPSSARLVGVRVGWMYALGWGLAAAIGAVAGIMMAPLVFLEPNMMLGVLLYGFAGAILGGIGNPWGAVIGGVFIGILENMIGAFVPGVGSDLKLTVALVVIVAVLTVKPAGVFGQTVVKRV